MVCASSTRYLEVIYALLNLSVLLRCEHLERYGWISRWLGWNCDVVLLLCPDNMQPLNLTSSVMRSEDVASLGPLYLWPRSLHDDELPSFLRHRFDLFDPETGTSVLSRNDRRHTQLWSSCPHLSSCFHSWGGECFLMCVCDHACTHIVVIVVVTPLGWGFPDNLVIPWITVFSISFPVFPSCAYPTPSALLPSYASHLLRVSQSHRVCVDVEFKKPSSDLLHCGQQQRKCHHDWERWTHSPTARNDDADVLLKDFLHPHHGIMIILGSACNDHGTRMWGGMCVSVMGCTVRCEDKVFLEVYPTPELMARPQ